MTEEIERIYVIPLRKTGFKSSKSAPSAVKRVREYLTRHMKVEQENIWIDDSLNNALWSHGKYSMPSKIRVKAVKFDDGVVEAYVPELEFKKSRRELLKEEREKKEPILKKEEAVPEGEAEAGAADYDIAPTADGEVKIKKKKAPKEKKEEEKPRKAKKPAKPKKKPEEKEEKPKAAKKPAKKKAAPKKKETKPKTVKKTTSKSAKKKSTSKKSKK